MRTFHPGWRRITACVALLTMVIPAAPAAAKCFGRSPTIVGTPGNDKIYRTSGNDVIVGRGGDDLIYGRGSHDRICTRSGSSVAVPANG